MTEDRMDTVSVSNLIRDLSVRSGRALLSQLGLRSPALRGYLENLYSRTPGEPGALLADPVLEATFGWKQADMDMQGLSRSGLLRKELVSAMAKPPRELRNEYAFPRSRKPFQHQLECWRHLLDDTPRSVLVTSGTGSGKTECFLVPILEDLARERARIGALTGVRALFLYPLNALINSQRDRLRAWCNGFGGDIRFCLYNGETPETAPAHEQVRADPEQISRKALRENPPPVLVTNSTMLEYMLVRTEDRPLLEQSRGTLRWVVLDEAHTYIGSQAAEMALLLRRVLHRFDVDPTNVRFVATSATIGGVDAGNDLQRFLADVSGAPPDRVHVVTGERLVPPLPEMDEARTTETLTGQQSETLYEALCHHPGRGRFDPGWPRSPQRSRRCGRSPVSTSRSSSRFSKGAQPHGETTKYSCRCACISFIGRSAACGHASIRTVPVETGPSATVGTSAPYPPTAAPVASTASFPSSSWWPAGSVGRTTCRPRRRSQETPVNTGCSPTSKRRTSTNFSSKSTPTTMMTLETRRHANHPQAAG